MSLAVVSVWAVSAGYPGYAVLFVVWFALWYGIFYAATGDHSVVGLALGFLFGYNIAAGILLAAAFSNA